eukprot:CAMPEP_0171071558 /NCGR_PEP_ID=MMETSP0766_2-20121228/10389_1 /TAXON_ID=439317 /ORGANISM="Gambierdiscus australes, Strain CAWD 149" /LENGTH=275 /DNA_ID=CAMNT_0011528107 /DNA_START=28 /DNA_END=855 /DNA_ORIENTATION=-
MSIFSAMCGPCKMVSDEDEAQGDPPREVLVVNEPALAGLRPKVQEEQTEEEVLPQQEVRICPVSGLSTLEGVCPFAKPKGGQKNGQKPQLRLHLDFGWEEGGSRVTVRALPHHSAHFATLGLPDTATARELKQAYLRLAQQHHPDKAHGDAERFRQVQEAYEALKDTNGELGFASDERQQLLTGAEAVLALAKVGAEACEKHHVQAIQLRHMVRTSAEVRLKVRRREQQGQLECWFDALCCDPSTGSDHIVRIYRRDKVNQADLHRSEGLDLDEQ